MQLSEPPLRHAKPHGLALDDHEPKYLTFRLGAEYGIDVLKIQEIRRYEAPTRIAGSAPWINGVLNLRGTMVPVVDLRTRLGMAPAAYDSATVTVIVSVHGNTTGLVVDSVNDVARLGHTSIQTLNAHECVMQAGYLTGIATVKGEASERTLMLLDADRLISPPAVEASTTLSIS